MTQPLNLDELFGQAKSVKVIHNGREYELMGAEGLGPKQSVEINKMRARAFVLNELGEKITEQQAGEIEEILSNMILILCPDFPVRELTFQKKTRIVEFYMNETQGKKKTQAALKKMTRTGRKRSQN